MFLVFRGYRQRQRELARRMTNLELNTDPLAQSGTPPPSSCPVPTLATCPPCGPG